MFHVIGCENVKRCSGDISLLLAFYDNPNQLQFFWKCYFSYDTFRVRNRRPTYFILKYELLDHNVIC